MDEKITITHTARVPMDRNGIPDLNALVGELAEKALQLSSAYYPHDRMRQFKFVVGHILRAYARLATEPASAQQQLMPFDCVGRDALKKLYELHADETRPQANGFLELGQAILEP